MKVNKPSWKNHKKSWKLGNTILLAITKEGRATDNWKRNEISPQNLTPFSIWNKEFEDHSFSISQTDTLSKMNTFCSAVLAGNLSDKWNPSMSTCKSCIASKVKIGIKGNSSRDLHVPYTLFNKRILPYQNFCNYNIKGKAKWQMHTTSAKALAFWVCLRKLCPSPLLADAPSISPGRSATLTWKTEMKLKKAFGKNVIQQTSGS